MLRLPRIIKSDFLCKLIAWSSALGKHLLSLPKLWIDQDNDIDKSNLDDP